MLREEKYTAMEASAFAFFPRSPIISSSRTSKNWQVIAFPGDWSLTPETTTWIQGDLHPQNIGYFDDEGLALSFSISKTSTSAYARAVLLRTSSALRA